MSRSRTKPTKWHVRPAKTEMSLGIRPVWSESSLSAWRKLGSLATHWAHSKDSDQTGRMPRLICHRWAHNHCVGFVTRRLICSPFQLLVSWFDCHSWSLPFHLNYACLCMDIWWHMSFSLRTRISVHVHAYVFRGVWGKLSREGIYYPETANSSGSAL